MIQTLMQDGGGFLRSLESLECETWRNMTSLKLDSGLYLLESVNVLLGVLA